MSTSNNANTSPGSAGTGPVQDSGSTNPNTSAADPAQSNGKGKRKGSPLEGSPAWVIDIIREATTKEVDEDLKANFVNDSPDMTAATEFFKKVNEKIHSANIQHETDPNNGLIPETKYRTSFTTWIKDLELAKNRNDIGLAWRAFDTTYNELKAFNLEHTLPQHWNIREQAVKDFFGPRPDAWVVDIIREEITKQEVHDKVKADFLGSSFDIATAVFQKLNEKIRQANTDHMVNPENGFIRIDSYRRFHSNWNFIMGSSKYPDDAELVWNIFDTTCDNFKFLNQLHGLPPEWNITEQLVEERFGPRIVESVENPDDDDNVTELDDLETEARQDLSFSDGEVLFWWKRGTGSQVFIRYGSRSNGIYRIRAGSNETYDPDSVPCLFSTSKRGQEREMVQMSTKRWEERLKWKREDVHGIIGVGWKVEDDDEEGLEALDLIWPEPYAKHPHTRILVQWKDKQVTLEDRTFIRRITKGSNLQGDRVIYQKALTQEIRFCQEQNLPFEHLLGRVPGAREASVHGEELESDEETEEELPQETNSGPRESVRASSAGRVSNRERSKASEVRFVEPQPSTRATSKGESVRPSPSQAYSQSVDNLDQRDAEIILLKSQIESLQKGANQRPSSQRASRYNDRYYDRASAVSETPEPRRRRRTQRKAWDNWAGRWVPAGRAY